MSDSITSISSTNTLIQNGTVEVKSVETNKSTISLKTKIGTAVLVTLAFLALAVTGYMIATGLGAPGGSGNRVLSLVLGASSLLLSYALFKSARDWHY